MDITSDILNEFLLWIIRDEMGAWKQPLRDAAKPSHNVRCRLPQIDIEEIKRHWRIQTRN